MSPTSASCRSAPAIADCRLKARPRPLDGVAPVMLVEHNLHGNEITKAEREVRPDDRRRKLSTALRQLERDGYISSWWDPKEQGRLAASALTDAGDAALRLWASPQPYAPI